MAASDTVPQHGDLLNPSPQFRRLAPARGVIALSGYGLSLRVHRGHLLVEDGIGSARRKARFARVGHGLRRVVVIGTDGSVSLAALRWLTDQKVAFVMLDRDGSVHVATGPVGPNDARLRRAQALAVQSDLALTIASKLIDRKLREQARVAREVIGDTLAAEAIEGVRNDLRTAISVDVLRLMESRAAAAYWRSWRAVPVTFPTADLSRVPEHWRAFGSRISPLTNSTRLSVNPPNAMLNYLYALLEAEARLAATAMGLDPGLGVMHADTRSRDNLAVDIMEPVRPLVDAYVLDWLKRQPLRRAWFFEERSGNCRLMAPLAERLAQTSSTWAESIAPIAEWIAKALWKGDKRPLANKGPATRLTQQRRREAKGGIEPAVSRPERPPRVCRFCGSSLTSTGTSSCAACWAVQAKARIASIAAKGRPASHTRQAEERRAASRRANAKAEREWDPTSKPEWLTGEAYLARIQPRLTVVKVADIVTATGLRRPYATRVRKGLVRPHPRHWSVLARLVGVER